VNVYPIMQHSENTIIKSSRFLNEATKTTSSRFFREATNTVSSRFFREATGYFLRCFAIPAFLINHHISLYFTFFWIYLQKLTLTRRYIHALKYFKKKPRERQQSFPRIRIISAIYGQQVTHLGRQKMRFRRQMGPHQVLQHTGAHTTGLAQQHGATTTGLGMHTGRHTGAQTGVHTGTAGAHTGLQTGAQTGCAATKQVWALTLPAKRRTPSTKTNMDFFIPYSFL